MRRKSSSILIGLVMALSITAVHANECEVSVANALEQTRMDYIRGVAGLASNNYSTRPGSYSSMACLDQFMQGEMDIFFRPPDLDSLLQQVLSFACDQIAEVIQGGGQGGMGGGEDMLALVKEFSGGLNVPSTTGGSMTVNMADFFNPQSTGSSGSLQGLFGGNR